MHASDFIFYNNEQKYAFQNYIKPPLLSVTKLVSWSTSSGIPTNLCSQSQLLEFDNYTHDIHVCLKNCLTFRNTDFFGPGGLRVPPVIRVASVPDNKALSVMKNIL